jgi:hypothetical protein
MTDRQIKHSGIQNVGYFEREDGERVFVNYDKSKQAYILGEENMTPEEYESAVETILVARRRVTEYFRQKDAT